jgi:hypothetical protein
MGSIIEEVRFGFSKPQHDFLSDRLSKYIAAVAGFGSGKTHVGLSRLLQNMMESPGIDQAYLAPSYPLIRDIFYPAVEKTLPEMGIGFHINKGAHTVYLEGLGKVYCRTMERPERIVGWEVADAVLDEFDILNIEKAMEVFRKTSARLRQKNPTGRINQLYVTTTPEGFKATYNLFKKDPLKNSRLIQMSTYSNIKNLPEGYIEDLREQYPDQLIEAYLNGQFVNLTSGAVYYAYDRVRHDTFYTAKPREPLHIGMDFNVRNMAAIVHVIRDGKVYAVDEFVGYRDTPDVIEAIKETYPEHRIFVYPDASGTHNSSTNASESDIAQLRDARFIVKANKTNPLIRNRVASMNNTFEKGHYRVNTRRCPQYADSLEQQVYGTNGMPDKSNNIDHPLDAGGYFIHYRFPIRKSTAQKSVIIGA